MSQQPDEFDLPPGLADALRAAYTHRAEIPPRADDSVLSAAREKFDRRRRLRLMVRWGSGLAAGLAAVIALAVILNRPAAPAKTLAKGDVDADGRVNMVDALALARRISTGDKLDAKWDFNGDGVVDHKDIDAIASASVSLKQTGLASHSLPKLHELGLDRLPVGSTLADVPGRATFARANPTASRTNEDREARP